MVGRRPERLVPPYDFNATDSRGLTLDRLWKQCVAAPPQQTCCRVSGELVDWDH